ncbi:MAG: OB-fold nucleic acid binding domain-containing protein [Prevotella sp.]|nr:OB-fold nucleic acid binding domain-containing protein [Prevotella sp.]
MNKILRFSMMAVLALVANIGFAQTTILWQEDFSSYKANDVPNGGAYNYACEGSGTKVYAEKLAGGNAPELLVSKQGGSFSATVALNGVSGQLTLTYKANNNTKTTVENATAGDLVKTGNDVSLPITVAAGTASITIKIANEGSRNVRLDNIKLFQGVGKKAPGLSWGTATRTVTIGAEDNKFPTLTNTYNLAVKYSSDDPDVAAIDATTGEITLGIAGKANITAEFEGNDEYEAAKVSYELTVKAASTVNIKNTPETAYTVAKALELINAGEGLDAKVYVKGQITSIKEVSASFGNATYDISDDATAANKLTVYRGYFYDNKHFTSNDQIKVGDVVVVYGKLVNYNNNTPQVTNSSIYSLNGVVSGVDNITVDKNVDAPAYNVAGQRVNDAYKGIVVKNGKKYLNK